MCLYSNLVTNPKYKPNKKNRGNVAPVFDERIKKVPIKCGECIECRKAKAREWQIRMLEDIKTNTNGKFITLTFSNQWITNIIKGYTERGKHVYGLSELYPEIQGYALDNAIATVALRNFNERWRRTYKAALRHWMITELGHKGTENIHLHGIIWTNETWEQLETHWKYGYIWPTKDGRKRNYVNGRTVNYIIKYITKKDDKHKTYKSSILTSPGIGSNYTKSQDFKKHKYNSTNTIETYKTSTGHKMAMPIYWRNKAFTETEREQLWIQKLNKQQRWICGEKIDISKTEEEYYKTLKWYQERNTQLGYGNGHKDWTQKKYEEQRRALMQNTRTAQKNTNAGGVFNASPAGQFPLAGVAGNGYSLRVRHAQATQSTQILQHNHNKLIKINNSIWAITKNGIYKTENLKILTNVDK